MVGGLVVSQGSCCTVYLLVHSTDATKLVDLYYWPSCLRNCLFQQAVLFISCLAHHHRSCWCSSVKLVDLYHWPPGLVSLAIISLCGIFATWLTIMSATYWTPSNWLICNTGHHTWRSAHFNKDLAVWFKYLSFIVPSHASISCKHHETKVRAVISGWISSLLFLFSIGHSLGGNWQCYILLAYLVKFA